MAEPVTIGKQTFIKTVEGWVDKKTKVKAPESLFSLLNSLTSESTTEYKKLRVKVDKTMPPITLAGEEYIFDLNQNKWINKKTRDAVNDTLQKIINGVLEKLEAEKASAAPAITTAMGTIGQAAKSTVKKPDGTKVPINIKINSPIVSMIEKLATIDGYLKQRLDNQKKIAARNIATARETAIEAKSVDAEPLQEVKTEDAEKSNVGSIAAALVVGGLIAAQFEPVRDAFKSLVDGVKGVWNFASDVAKTMADGLDFFNGTSSSASTTSTTSSASSATAVGGQRPLDPSTPNVVQNPSEGVPSEPNRSEASPISQSEPNEAAASRVSSSGGSTALGRTVVGAAIGARIAGPAGALVGGAIGFISAPSDEGPPSYSPSPSTPNQNNSGGNNTAERVGTPSNGPMGDFAANFKDPVPNGRWSGPGLGQSREGGRRRHQGMDIFAPIGTPVYAAADGEVVYSERRSGDGGGSGFGMAVQLRHADGYTTKYAHLSRLKGYSKGDRVSAGDVIGYVGDTGNAKGTSPHLHFEIWKNRTMQEPANFLSGANKSGYAADDGSGTGDNLMGMAQNATSQLWDLGTAAIEAIGGIIKAGVGPQVLRPITDSLVSSAPSIAPEIAAASTLRIGAMAEARAQAQTSTPSLPDPPNLNAGTGSPVVQNLPTASDMAGVDFYLTRMGFPKIEYHNQPSPARMA